LKTSEPAIEGIFRPTLFATEPAIIHGGLGLSATESAAGMGEENGSF